jgi:serine/threonine protein kinase/tetratricopeptide (TPR) repeat protein
MIGTLLNGRYRIDQELGQGGMGTIYSAYDTLLGRQVAIKLLAEAARSNLTDESRSRLLNEAQAAARLNHPNIVSVYDAGQVDGAPYIVMELIKGESLYVIKPTSLEAIVDITRQVCAALAHAHANGIIHRDLKPENVIVTPEGVVKLTDFGLAGSITSRLSSEGLVVGTVLYLSPEAAMGKPIDGRSDLYSLGIMLYEMTTGKLPYSDTDPLAVISQHLNAHAPPPRALRTDIPQALDSLIIQLMNKNPDDRPASAEEVYRLLAILENFNRLDISHAKADQERPLLDRLERNRLVGREREMGEINSLWQRALSGETTLVFVTGEPGIGKTRLLHEVVARASLDTENTFSGECYPEGNTPYAPFRQIIKDSFDEAGERLELPNYVMADLITIAPELRDRFHHIQQNPTLDALSEQQHIFDSVVAWCAALSAKSPLLLVIEDIHWADSGTLFLLRHIARRAHKLRMLVAMTYRETDVSDVCCLPQVLYDFNRERLASRIKLLRFDHDQTRQMLAALLGSTGQIDEDLADAIYHETEGNPFFIEEVCKALIEEGKLRIVDECWVADEIEEMDIPQSIRMTVLSRLAHLPKQSQDILVMAAILGREFDFETLKHAAEVDEDSLIEALEAAEKAQIISELPRRKGSSLVFSFGHALIPSSLCDSISGLRRQRLHRRAAAAIEASRPPVGAHLEALAFHYAQAGDEENALRYSIRAAEHALSVYANQEAERYFRQALDLSQRPAERAHVLSGLGEALFRQTRWIEVENVLAQAVDLYKQEGDFDYMARLYARRARVAWYTGGSSRGLDLCLQGLAAVPASMETFGMAALLHETARAYRFNNLPEEALPLCRQALDLARRLELVEVQADALATLGILSNQSLEEARQALQKAVDLAESAGLLVTAIRAHTNLAEHFRNTGSLSEGRDHMLRASEVAGRAGIIPWQYDLLANAYEIAIEMADLDFMVSKLPELRSLASRLTQPGETSLHLRAIEARLERFYGRLDTAISLLQNCIDEASQRGLNQLKPGLTALLADILIESDRLDEARQALNDALLQPQVDMRPDFVMALLIACWLNTRLGNLEEATRLYQQANQIVKETKSQEFFPPLIQLTRMLRLTEARMDAANHAWDAANAAYRDVIELTASFGMPWDQAHVLVEWADALPGSTAGPDGEKSDQRLRARQHLQEARNIYKQLKSSNYVDLVNKKLQSN